MRMRLPDLRTLPSSTELTFKTLPISLTLVFLPLNEKAEVRAATFRSSILASALRSSSANPSQKYSFSASLLMLANGNTAMEFCVFVSGRLGDEAERSNSAENSKRFCKCCRSAIKSLAVRYRSVRALAKALLTIPSSSVGIPLFRLLGAAGSVIRIAASTSLFVSPAPFCGLMCSAYWPDSSLK